MKRLSSFAVLMLVMTGAAQAQADKYGVTPEERAACEQDATLLCSYTYPDEDKLVECMRRNRIHLTQYCRTTFDAGLRRRHMAL